MSVQGLSIVHIMPSDKNRRNGKTSGNLRRLSRCVPSRGGRGGPEISSVGFTGRQRREGRAEVGRKKRADLRSRIRTLKVRYFPRASRNPFREVSYWPRNSIKRSNIERALSRTMYTRSAQPVIKAARKSATARLDSPVISKTCVPPQTRCPSRRTQIAFSRNSLRFGKTLRGRNLSMMRARARAVPRIRTAVRFAFVSAEEISLRKFPKISGPDCEKVIEATG